LILLKKRSSAKKEQKANLGLHLAAFLAKDPFFNPFFAKGVHFPNTFAPTQDFRALLETFAGFNVQLVAPASFEK